jgi:hypothetical protein
MKMKTKNEKCLEEALPMSLDRAGQSLYGTK